MLFCNDGRCCFAMTDATEDGMQFSSQVMVEFLDLVPIVGNSFEALWGWLACCLNHQAMHNRLELVPYWHFCPGLSGVAAGRKLSMPPHTGLAR